ncbi:MAG: hypothetical protein F4X64_10845 [Chloroflexi bacterium]|nr:hypothetical protein [Chloroflexota bacterium]
MRQPERSGQISDRGIWWQIIGFTVVGGGCLTILEVFSGSEFWAYQWFETTVTKLYWAFVIPMAGLFDEARKMFETKMEIRRAARAKVLAKARAEARREERQKYNSRVDEALQRFQVSDELAEFLRGETEDAE